MSRCNKKGHFEARCLTKHKQVAEIEGEVDTAFLGAVGSAQTTAWLTTLQLNERKIRFKLDTGAEATAISMETYNTIQRPNLSTQKDTPWTIAATTRLHWRVPGHVWIQRPVHNTTGLCHQGTEIQPPRTSGNHSITASYSHGRSRRGISGDLG